MDHSGWRCCHHDFAYVIKDEETILLNLITDFTKPQHPQKKILYIISLQIYMDRGEHEIAIMTLYTLGCVLVSPQ